MSSRNIRGFHELPANPTWLEFPRSDGSPNRLPANTTRIVEDGQVNFMRPVPIDEGSAIGWRMGAGKEVAVRMNLPKGVNYVFKDWPYGYAMYDHNKGPADNPRHDIYLCGSISVNRFRSINEFIPHALWLMQDATMNRANCKCKYCTKQPQRIITDTLQLPSVKRAPSQHISTRSVRPSRRFREPRIVKKPYAAIRKAPKPIRQLTGPSQSIVPERDSDIRALLSGSELAAPRWHRKGELVWCFLDSPIRGEGERDSIHFWPGTVEDVNVRTKAIPKDVTQDAQRFDQVDVDMTLLYEQESEAEAPRAGYNRQPLFSSVDASSHLSSARNQPGQESEPATEQSSDVPWEVRQWNVYTVKLLAITHSYVGTDTQVLPYLAYAPPHELVHRMRSELLDFMREVPVQDMDGDMSKIFPFNPVAAPTDSPVSDGRRFREAVAPFTLAIQIASTLSHFWAPTDEYEFQFEKPSALSAPPPPPPPPSQLAPPSASTAPASSASNAPATLHSLIMQSMTNNATELSARASAQTVPSSVIGAHDPGMSSEGSHSVKAATLEQASHPSGASVTQQRFQGLWWGAEHIWQDELLRLKLSRHQFAPQGTEEFVPPSGPSSSTLEQMRDNGFADVVDEAMIGAAYKGLFLRLEGLFTVDVPTADGSGGFTKECRACGTVYELADDDWEEPAASNASVDAPAEQEIGKGKGKEKAHEGERAMHGFPGSISSHSGVPGLALSPGSAPMRRVPLPDLHSIIPVEETAATIISQPAPSAIAVAKERDTNTQLAHPVLTTPFRLPDPPKGFKFRPIHPPGCEVVIALTFISGRYYPHLFRHPLMVPLIERAATASGGLWENRHLWAMEGLLAGVYQSMETRKWQKSRTAMLKEADQEARAHFAALWEECRREREEQERPMDGENNPTHSVHDKLMDIDRA
ncbi:uncharacterized protein LAESUDRAFT_645510 [Laetiporus sulphureus 93-53]|uniref:Cryptic loci regulator 2 N-terminal domain-containing protein n=1 Tax=Laetiporus sulphureus 93-53 TaxID=1314785 RepID=A0A165G8Q5_9APHY|nr:uncharacterized protein LAESUDRAFT_645510 [Laetiporus sulphureus 93-53]KZT09986.1 hypothetical protein LAESUDRAFT_645510 [Laetiporus sulphureus 93-53]